MNLAIIEALLDTRQLQVLCGTGWYDARRNGETKTWKRQPNAFRIPIKVGFRTCGYITHDDIKLGMVREKPSYRPDLTTKQNHDIARGMPEGQPLQRGVAA
jgi:hypothetical protein